MWFGRVPDINVFFIWKASLGYSHILTNHKPMASIYNRVVTSVITRSAISVTIRAAFLGNSKAGIWLLLSLVLFNRAVVWYNIGAAFLASTIGSNSCCVQQALLPLACFLHS